MMMLIVGYDGSTCADEAIDGLTRAGLPSADVEAHVISIADVWPAPPGEEYKKAFPEAYAKIRANLARELGDAERCSAKGAQRLGALFPNWHVVGEGLADSPYWGLIARADATHADLIVVGSHGHTAVGRALLGSVSHNVALYANCAVRIGRTARTRNQPGDAGLRILIAWDNSPSAAAAVDAVASRDWPKGSSVRMVTAIDARLSSFIPVVFPLTTPWESSSGYTSGALDEHLLIDAHAKASLDKLRSTGLAVEDLVIKDGIPKQVLRNEAHQWGADCVFMGARGLSRMQRVLLGSVAAGVAARAVCSVEIVRVG
ncbi:MAG: universal stress protein [Planctomycetota bacterium]|nr:universal stress protein [Planctomycetota bacterium]